MFFYREKVKYNLVFKNYFLLFSGFCLCVWGEGGGG